MRKEGRVVRVSQSNELVKAVLVYCAGRLAEGDIQPLLDLGLDDTDLKELATLKLVDLAQANRFKGCLRVEVKLDVPAFRTMLRHARGVFASDECERTLILADAPFAMMNSLFGISNRDFTRMRAQLSVESPPGRPPAPHEGTIAKLRQAIERRVKAQGSDSLLRPQDYLDIADECDASMRHVWAVAQERARACGHSASPS